MLVRGSPWSITVMELYITSVEGFPSPPVLERLMAKVACLTVPDTQKELLTVLGKPFLREQR